MGLLLLLVIFNLNAWAESYDVRISDLDSGEETLIFLSNGIVAKSRRPKLQKLLEEFRATQRLARIELDSERRVLSLALSPVFAPSSQKSFHSASEFKVSILPSLDVAKAIFKSARSVAKESQCYNRAHIWAFEWFQKYGLHSEKVFIFFTRKYIRKYDFDWWFHVAPSVPVIDGPNVEQRVLDVKYALGGPMRLRNWTNMFMRNDASCALIEKYSEYANYPESGWCYIMKTPMFTYQPIDIENLEDLGEAKMSWIESELSAAYLEAFNQTWPQTSETVHDWH